MIISTHAQSGIPSGMETKVFTRLKSIGIPL